MDFLLTNGVKHTCSLPEGMRELLMDISREVLRSQPTQIYSFIADYLDALLITREHARVAARVVNCFVDAGTSLLDLLVRAGMTQEQSVLAVKIIRHAFNAHSRDRMRGLATKLQEFEVLQHIIKETDITAAQAVKAAIIIQSVFKSYRLQQLNQTKVSSNGVINWQKAAIRTTDCYKQTKPTKRLLNRAASLIQVAYRAYYKRRNVYNHKANEIVAENCLCTIETCQPDACECISQINKYNKKMEDSKHILKELSSELFLCEIKDDRNLGAQPNRNVDEKVKITIQEKEYTERVYKQPPEEHELKDDDSIIIDSEYSKDFESYRTVESAFEKESEYNFSNKSICSDKVLVTESCPLLTEVEVVESNSLEESIGLDEKGL